MFDLALLQREVYPRKMKDLIKLKQQLEQNSGLVQAKVSSACMVALTKTSSTLWNSLTSSLEHKICWIVLTSNCRVFHVPSHDMDMA